MKSWLQIHPNDNVAVALQDLPAGFFVEFGTVSFPLKEAVSRGHKFSLRLIANGENVIKYGVTIGHATADIQCGYWVHTHNLKTNLSGQINYEYHPVSFVQKKQPSAVPFFQGYRRQDGNVGIRNELWVIPTVGCINEMAIQIAANYKIHSPNVDGPYVFTHPYGCSQLGDDHATTRRILADLVRHPNAGGVLVVALGCENNTLEEFQKEIGNYDPNRVKFLVAQQEKDEIATGSHLLGELEAFAATSKRTNIPVSELKIGLKCGGSDGLSGITANPLVGRCSDLLTSYGGISVLTEVPEMFGAEISLMNRCENREIFNACVSMINGFKEYFLKHGTVVYENPSPGNKSGGISTLEDKSLGCVQKGGDSIVKAVLNYGDTIQGHGLHLLSAPGNDVVASTALTAAGCHLILFTTGRGTPLGAPVPTLKISTNSQLAQTKENWIDFDAGCLLQEKSMETATKALWQLILDTASGKPAKNEINHCRGIAIFKDGVTL